MGNNLFMRNMIAADRPARDRICQVAKRTDVRVVDLSYYRHFLHERLLERKRQLLPRTGVRAATLLKYSV
jgi:hypothetical protein